MTQFRMYGISPADIADPVTNSMILAAQEAINQAIRDAGLDDEAQVCVTWNPGRYSFLPSREINPDLCDAVDAGLEAFYAYSADRDWEEEEEASDEDSDGEEEEDEA